MDPTSPKPIQAQGLLTARTLVEIIEVQTAIANDLDVERVMQMVLDSAQRLLAGTGAVVEFVEGEELVCRAASGASESRVGARRPIDVGLAGGCVRTGAILRCDDTETDDRVDRDACRQLGVQSMVVVPLHRQRKTIGVLEVNSATPFSFTDRHSQVLQLLAGFIANTLHNATAYSEVSHQALRDPLTGLANRLVFGERIAHHLARAQRYGGIVGIVYVDLDDFKIVNDTLGHAAGDELLVAVGRRLVRAVRESDTVARLGGDEFGIVVADLHDAAELEVVADQVRTAIAGSRVPFGGTEVPVHASVGCAVANQGDNAETLTRRADADMYRVKNARQESAQKPDADRKSKEG